MGLLDQAKRMAETAKQMAVQNRDKLDKGIDSAARFARGRSPRARGAVDKAAGTAKRVLRTLQSQGGRTSTPREVRPRHEEEPPTG